MSLCSTFGRHQNQFLPILWPQLRLEAHDFVVSRVSQQLKLSRDILPIFVKLSLKQIYFHLFHNLIYFLLGACFLSMSEKLGHHILEFVLHPRVRFYIQSIKVFYDFLDVIDSVDGLEFHILVVNLLFLLCQYFSHLPQLFVSRIIERWFTQTKLFEGTNLFFFMSSNMHEVFSKRQQHVCQLILQVFFFELVNPREQSLSLNRVKLGLVILVVKHISPKDLSDILQAFFRFI